MLTMELTTWDRKSYRLPILLSWTLTYTAGVPCDSMTACCPYDDSMADVLPAATRFTASQDGEIMLRGVIDAYEISLSGQGLLVTLEGRGMAALLMDNESEALTYGTATLGDILGNHVSPYGIETVGGGGLEPVRAFHVTSGVSEWSVVEEYLRFCAELKKIPKEQRTDQLAKVLALTHLEDMSARLIRNLSKGYRQRVGLAQAILGFPKIIILDEPTVGLDPKQVVEIRDLIRHLAKDHTVILSSHILSEIRAVCDRVLIIRKGRFVVCDTPEDLEEKLSAGGSLELTAKAAPEAAEAVLDRVAGITGRTLLGRTEDTARFAIQMEGDIREALFFAFAKAGLPLLELRPRTASLEEVFLDLTDDDDTVAARAAALFQTPAETAEKEAGGDEGDL